MSTTTTRPTTLGATDVRTWLDQPSAPRIIDVRTPGEFATTHIPGAYNVPLGLLEEHQRELAQHLDEDIVLVCQSGARATRAEKVLAQSGPSTLHILEGGITAWESAGGDLVHGEQGWDLERQVRLVAGSIVLTGILASTVVPQAKWVSAGIGAGLTGAALTNTCAMGMLLSKLPHNRRHDPAPETVVAQLRAGRV
ncbi:rhodanese-like domain-containing protein [Janibacter sp. GS2]|uniref:rhodanese-like domain-containing protein n=1 Tax=Janibacter sp. GS2 TaxID=3442646 RepID=UPI003EBA068D